jgi:hypothetical protein
MALVTTATLKRRLRIQTTAYDTTIEECLNDALGACQAYLGRPIVSRNRAFVDRAESERAYASVTKLLVPVTPLLPATVVVTDRDGVTVDSADYAVRDRWSGVIEAAEGVTFANGPYTIACDVGLDCAEEYADTIEPAINALLTDVALDYYQRRNPAAASESAGGGIMQTYNESANTELPSRIRAQLAPWRLLPV